MIMIRLSYARLASFASLPLYQSHFGAVTNVFDAIEACTKEEIAG